MHATDGLRCAQPILRICRSPRPLANHHPRRGNPRGCPDLAPTPDSGQARNCGSGRAWGPGQARGLPLRGHRREQAQPAKHADLVVAGIDLSRSRIDLSERLADLAETLADLVVAGIDLSRSRIVPSERLADLSETLADLAAAGIDLAKRLADLAARLALACAGRHRAIEKTCGPCRGRHRPMRKPCGPCRAACGPMKKPCDCVRAACDCIRRQGRSMNLRQASMRCRQRLRRGIGACIARRPVCRAPMKTGMGGRRARLRRRRIGLQRTRARLPVMQTWRRALARRIRIGRAGLGRMRGGRNSPGKRRPLPGAGEGLKAERGGAYFAQTALACVRAGSENGRLKWWTIWWMYQDFSRPMPSSRQISFSKASMASR